MMRSWYIWAIVFIQFALHITTVKNQQDFRLPGAIIPTHYDLQLQPILDETPGYTRFSAPGKVTIRVNCTEDTTIIKLHALEITIIESATSVRSVATGKSLAITSVGTEPENQFLVISLTSSLQQGSQYDIYIEFITPVSQTRLDGMYLDSYIDPETNITKYVATTTFAAISARRCYPSFDEPPIGRVFNSIGEEGSLPFPVQYESNFHRTAVWVEGMNGWFLDKFAPSLPMSTYLVAMIVSDMTYEQAPASTSADDTIIRVYAPYYFINRGGGVYAANQTKTVLAKYEGYYNSTFMLPKLDSVSLPRLITYNDRVLLYFPNETTEQERYRITNIIAHEVAHNYFGNEVTCEWWTWIWLNEGFATYVSHLGVQLTYPEFNPWDRFINDVYQVAMEFDTSAATHPVANEPATLADIGAVYDDIAYEKGASLLKMMHSFLTEDVMQTAIRRYIAQNQLSTVRQDDLFETIQVAADEASQVLPASVKTIMDTWTLLSGFPLVRVERISPTQVKFSQEKYLADPGNNDRWWIPISVSVISSQVLKEYFFWIPSGQNETTFDIPDNEVFVINPRSDGYYRTLYSTELLETILNHTKKAGAQTLSGTAVANLLDNYIAFKKAGLEDVCLEDIINNFSCPGQENLVVWRTIFRYYTSELLQAYQDGDYTGVTCIKDSMKQLLPAMNSALEKIGNEQKPFDKGDNVVLRSELLFWTCFLDSNKEICRNYAYGKMNAWIEKDEEVSPFPVDLEEIYFCVAASMNQTHWERIYNLMESKTLLPGSKTRLLSVLTCTDNVEALHRIEPKLIETINQFKSYIWQWKVRVQPEHLSLFRMTPNLLDNKYGRSLLAVN